MDRIGRPRKRSMAAANGKKRPGQRADFCFLSRRDRRLCFIIVEDPEASHDAAGKTMYAILLSSEHMSITR